MARNASQREEGEQNKRSKRDRTRRGEAQEGVSPIQSDRRRDSLMALGAVLALTFGATAASGGNAGLSRRAADS